jgi:hypothetical protein
MVFARLTPFLDTTKKHFARFWVFLDMTKTPFARFWGVFGHDQNDSFS